MGSHAKPRTTGRKAALGALTLGASLSGVGLIAAALDPATAVLTATGADGEGATQLSGLSSPVSLDLTPAADSIENLSSAALPSTSTSSAPASTAQDGTQASAVDWFTKPARTTTSTTRSSGTSGSGSETAVKPIVYSNPTQSSGSGSTGKHKVTSSGTPPTGASGITSAIQDAAAPVTSAVQSAVAPVTSAVQSAVAPVTSTVAQVLPAVQSLVSQVPVVSTLVRDTGASSTVSSVPLVGSLLGGSGDGQSAVTVPGLSSVTGLL
jgi:hypothetical protein